ncbi:MAG: 30S ribosomal protein S8 [Deltaproteobacteria bacterium RIFOXYD12_FULL_50_9]|nr:MAG: 30S ribosomal protein S8 [Deltaproteobacteria bacterium RIFOXYD12_FULL_50_9]
MSMSDPIADMLTRIRNAGLVRFESVDIPLSNLKVDIAKILKSEGYISDFHIIKGNNKQGVIRLDLKYDQNKQGVITGIKRVSSPGCRVYVKADEIPKVMSGFGISIISTSKGMLSTREAQKNGVGGELICDVW